MYNANVIEVLIASPSDVKEERQLVKDSLYKWNAIHSKKENIILKSLCWEDNVYSSFECDYPQENINKQILKDADILIGIFWTRIGTPTPKHPSGSIEEIKEHIDSDKPTMLFFSNAEIKPNQIDKEQYENLQNFKQECFKRGIATEYESKDNFSDKFEHQLGLLINNKIIPKISSNQPPISQNIQKTTETQAHIIKQSISQNNELSDLEKIILKEMSQDKNGYLLHIKTLGGEHIQTNGKGWDLKDKPREVADFESSIEELENKGLVKCKNAKRTWFQITSNGYKLQ